MILVCVPLQWMDIGRWFEDTYFFYYDCMKGKSTQAQFKIITVLDKKRHDSRDSVFVFFVTNFLLSRWIFSRLVPVMCIELHFMSLCGYIAILRGDHKKTGVEVGVFVKNISVSF